MYNIGDSLQGDRWVGQEWPAHPGASAVRNIDLPDTIPQDVAVEELALDIVVELGAVTTSIQIDSRAEFEALISTIVSAVEIQTDVYKEILPAGVTVVSLLNDLRLAFGVDVQIWDETGEEITLGTASFAVTANTAKLRLHVPVMRFTDLRSGRHPLGANVGRSVYGRSFVPYYTGIQGLNGGTTTIRFGPMTAVSLGGTSWTPTINRTSVNFVLYGQRAPWGADGSIPHVTPIRAILPITRSDDLIRASTTDLLLLAYRTDQTVEDIADLIANIGGAPALQASAQRIDLLSGNKMVGPIDNGSNPASQDWPRRHKSIMATLNTLSGDYLRRFYENSTDTRTGPLLADLYGPALVGPAVALGKSYLPTGLPQLQGQIQGSIVQTGTNSLRFLGVRPLSKMSAAPLARASVGGEKIPFCRDANINSLLAPFLPTRPIG